MTQRQNDDAATFRRLHSESGVLVLPNAWDAGSARLIENCGARAIATSSAAVAWAHGYPDGEYIPVAVLVGAVDDILRVVRIPVSVDVEAGYSADSEGIAELLAPLFDAGVVGINLQDDTAPPQLLAKKIAVAKRTAEHLGVDVFVNARTDVYLRKLATVDTAVEETLKRARIYRNAGADGLFVPGLVERTHITAIATGMALPLNVLARAKLAPVADLARWGVRRLSVGCALAQGALSRVRHSTEDLLARGTYRGLRDDIIPSSQMNALFSASNR